jgi:UBX domain-containing protein 1
LTFWRNGFSIDDGPLRDFNDPENEAFLNSIKNGMAPLQYLNLKPGQKVELKIAHRSDQDYQPPPKAPMKAFSGSGQRLGSIVPGSSSSVASSTPVPDAQSIKFQVNQDEPMTSVQIRLGDGTRLVLKCNHSHTIGDIRNFILASRPGESSRLWVLQTAHPSKVLDNLNQTIKEAGLLNSVVIQRYS